MPIRRVLSHLSCRGLAWAALLCVSAAAWAGETDQYMTWDVTLQDSSTALNAWLNDEAEAFLDRVNRRSRPPADSGAVTIDFYQYLFQGLHASRIRRWLKNAETVDRYPGDELSDWAYQRESIFRRPAFPFILPMAQTVRIGEVYLGIDKIGHMFGFGRRYFQIYQRHRAAGLDHDAAVERVLTWGIQHEASVVGRVVDGIFSRADLEANYQGFRLALALGAGDAPRFHRVGKVWTLRGPLDLRDYVTPDFDESFNTSDYAPWRARRVVPVLEALYGDAPVPARFAAYRAGYVPSPSQRFVEAQARQKGYATPEIIPGKHEDKP